MGFTYWRHSDFSPAVVDGIVYVGSEDHNLYAFNAANGDQFGTTQQAIMLIQIQLLATE